MLKETFISTHVFAWRVKKHGKQINNEVCVQFIYLSLAFLLAGEMK